MASNTSASESRNETHLNKGNVRVNDLETLVHDWHKDLLANEKLLLQRAAEFDQQQEKLDRQTTTLVEVENLLETLEENLFELDESVKFMTKCNDCLENQMKQLDVESKKSLVTMKTNMNTEQERTATYNMMEQVDVELKTFEEKLVSLKEKIGFDKDASVFTLNDQITTCFHELEKIQESLKDLSVDEN